MSGPHTGNCKHCGKQTEYQYKSWVKDYCSYACSNAAKWETRPRSEVKSYQCVNCEKPFSLLAYQASHRENTGKTIKFCSTECGGLARIKSSTYQDTTCAHCGTAVKKRHDHIRERNYCSRKCVAASRRTEGSTWSGYNHDQDSRLRYMRAYTAKNRERKNTLSRQWAKQHIEYRRFINALRRAAGLITFEQWQQVVKDASGRCKVCDNSENLQVDHIVAVAKGGKTEPGNLQLLCRFCNISKGAKPFSEWLPKRLKEVRS